MVNKEDISRFSKEALWELLAKDPAQLIAFLEKFSSREIRISQIGIPVNRKLLYTWKKADLIPFLPSENTWMRFSFLDVAWLQFMLEFRSVGVGLEKLHQIKNKFFDPSFVKSIFSNLTPLSDSYPEIKQQLETTLAHRFDKLELTTEVSQLLEDLQFSLFSMMVYALIMQKANWSFYIDGEGRLSVIDLNKLMEDPLSELPELHEILSDRTIAMVNLRKIITQLTDSNDFFKNDLQIGMVMSENSVQQLKKLFKENNVQEIAITMGRNDRPIIRTKQHISLEECEKEIRKLQKKGNFSNVAIKTRDGKIQVFEKTDLIKL